jgi:hypothetical protein
MGRLISLGRDVSLLVVAGMLYLLISLVGIKHLADSWFILKMFYQALAMICVTLINLKRMRLLDT